MYATCLFCHGPLGANDVVASFPVGRRLAFDAALGRLWVVCTACERWNLSPLEERWEAVECCERLFRGLRLRAQTDQIGLARVAGALELVRIGRPLRPEFAAWRYGRQFGERLRRTALWASAGAAVGGAGVAAGMAAGAAGLVLGAAGAVPFALVLGAGAGSALVDYCRNGLATVRVPAGDGAVYALTSAEVAQSRLAPAAGSGAGGECWGLSLRHALGRATLDGDAARRALGVLLAWINRFGASAPTVRQSAALIADRGGPGALVDLLAEQSGRLAAASEARLQARRWDEARRSVSARRQLRGDPALPSDPAALPNLPLEHRLALEMALHEETERRAMEGELAPLEAAWREAELVAGIADGLLSAAPPAGPPPARPGFPDAGRAS